MTTSVERAINNTFQILEEFQANEIQQSFYQPPKKAKNFPRAQRAGSVKTFSEEEIFLLNVKRFIQAAEPLNER